MRCFFLVLLLAPIILAAQEYKIIGEVYDQETGVEITMATVLVKGKTVGALSDLDGKFSLRDTVPILRIEIRAIGYETKTFDISESTTSTAPIVRRKFVLRPEEVYDRTYKPRKILPYAQQNLRDYHRMKGITSTHLPAANGSFVGTQINPLSGDPAATLSLRIRGHNHIASSNAPLYVIDDMEIIPVMSGLLGGQYLTPGSRDPLRFLHPSEIKQLSVLRGPETAQFGQRGSNGVVKIKTAQANTKAFLHFQQKLSLSYIPSWPKLLNRSSYQNWAQTSERVPNELLQNADQDWLGKFARRALASEQDLILGGKYLKRIPYRLGIHLQNRQGHVEPTSFHRLQANFSTVYERGNWQVPINYSLSFDGGQLLPSTASAMPRGDILLNAFGMNPTLRDATEANPFFPNPLRIQRDVLFSARGFHHMLRLKPKYTWGNQNYLEADLAWLNTRENTFFDSPQPVNSFPTSQGKTDIQLRNSQLGSKLSYYKAIKKYSHHYFFRASWRSQFQWRSIINGNLIWQPPFAPGAPQSTPNYASFSEFPALSTRSYHAPELYFRLFSRQGINLVAGLRAVRLQCANEINYLVPEN